MFISFGLACFISGAFIGMLSTHRTIYHARYLNEYQLISQIVHDDPAYANVQIFEQSKGGVFLTGNIQSDDDFVRLKSKIAFELGNTRAEEITQPLSHPKRFK